MGTHTNARLARLANMRRSLNLSTLLAGAAGLVLLAIGVVYLSVECQALPGFLGPTHGDTSPRTGFGIVGVVAGLSLLVAALIIARRPSLQ
jgi:hypothetical protein